VGTDGEAMDASMAQTAGLAVPCDATVAALEHAFGCAGVVIGMVVRADIQHTWISRADGDRLDEAEVQQLPPSPTTVVAGE
jgi:hypothetical protein